MASETKKRTPKRTPAKAADEGLTAEQQDVDIPKSITVNRTFKTYRAGQFGHEDVGLSEERVLAMFRNMLLQRRFEERAAQMYGKQKIGGFLHLYIGQEAVSTGAVNAIRIGHDSVITAYRDHGHALALGMTADECMAELFGRIDGCSRGKGGSMHFFSAKHRFFGGHGIVGAHVPVGTGIAFAHKYQADDGVCLTFFGDGAVGQGAIHEASNLAALYELPVVFIVENNQYAMGTATTRAFAETMFIKHALSYHMEASLVNGMDVFAVCKAVQDHVAMARDFKPSLLEVRTYRYRGHSMSDPGKYRTKEELERKKHEDPILRLKMYILEHKMADLDALDAMDEEVKEEVRRSVEFAENSPFPPLESIYEDVYTQKDYPFLA
ncbi:pyruvate dehydrogenase (acetyl-transferring) E1 component subunit alpha [Rhodocaloribacter sp.]